jgi:hypothetical protein
LAKYRLRRLTLSRRLWRVRVRLTVPMTRTHALADAQRALGP